MEMIVRKSLFSMEFLCGGCTEPTNMTQIGKNCPSCGTIITAGKEQEREIEEWLQGRRG